MRQADVVRVHPRDDVVAARREPALERLRETDVVRQAKSPNRHRRVRLQALQGGGEVGADVTVLNDDDLIGTPELFVHGAAEGRLEVVRAVATVDGQQEGERCVHVEDATDAARPDGERAATRV